jgi:hypothetical protein
LTRPSLLVLQRIENNFHGPDAEVTDSKVDGCQGR